MGANRWTGLVGGMLLWSTLILIENSARYVHQDEEGRTDCKICPDSMTTFSQGVTYVGQYLCPEGQWSLAQGQCSD